MLAKSCAQCSVSVQIIKILNGCRIFYNSFVLIADSPFYICSVIVVTVTVVLTIPDLFSKFLFAFVLHC